MITHPTRTEMMRAVVPGSAGAEIGVQGGVFSRELFALGPSALHLIDPWKHWPDDPDYDLDGANFPQQQHDWLHASVAAMFYPHGHVQIHRLTSAEAAPKFADGSLDWVYIDARHTYEAVTEDLRLWAPKLRAGGSLCGHDYTDSEHARMMHFGVYRAVNEFCENCGWQLTATTQEYWPSYRLEKNP